MPLREHVYCVAVTFKMTEQLEQQICIKFCIKLRVNYLDDLEGHHNYEQLVIGSFIKSCLVMHHYLCRVFGKTSSHPSDSAPLQPGFGAL